MTTARGAISPVVSDYSETIIGHWPLTTYKTDNGVYYTEDSSPSKYTLETTIAPSAGILGTSGRFTFNGSTDKFENIPDVMSGAMQWGKDKDPSHGSPALPSLVISFGINFAGVGANDYPIVAQGTGGTNYGAKIITTTSGDVGLSWIGVAAGNGSSVSSATINDSADHMVCIIIDRNNNKGQIWIDGSLSGGLDGAVNSVFGNYADLSTNGKFTLGALNNDYWAGQLWNVQIYKTFKTIPAGGDAGVALRLGWVTTLNAGGYLTKSDL